MTRFLINLTSLAIFGLLITGCTVYPNDVGYPAVPPSQVAYYHDFPVYSRHHTHHSPAENNFHSGIVTSTPAMSTGNRFHSDTVGSPSPINDTFHSGTGSPQSSLNNSGFNAGTVGN